VTADLAERLRAICLALPEVTERPSHGVPTWFVRGKSSFVTLWAEGHHGNQFPHLWCAAPAGAQAELTASVPGQFFRPPYVGSRGWLGVRLDGDVDWAEIAELCQDAYRAIAPARLAAQLDHSPAEHAPGDSTAAVISAAQPQDNETPAPPCP
jgi:YjbR